MDSAHWHFFESPVTGKAGASQPLKDYLDQANILTGGIGKKYGNSLPIHDTTVF